METFTQILSAIYVALGEAAGGPHALLVANKVLRDAIADGAVDDPAAIEVLQALSHDEDDLEEVTELERQPFTWFDALAHAA
jgi:hypothetical protein